MLCVVAMGAFCGFEILHSTGIVGVTKKPGHKFAGCICHDFDPSQTVRVLIAGPDSLALGDTATYTLSVIRDTNIAAGFNVAAFSGELSVGDTVDQQLLEGELTHTMPKFSGGNDTIQWIFHYRAPEFSTFDTLYADGNSVNNDTAPSGDYWNFSDDFIVRVGNPVNVADNASPIPMYHRLLQNYPNPFNPTTVIGYLLPVTGATSLKVFNMLGEEVATLVDGVMTAGEHDVVFDGKDLCSGIYVYRLAVNGVIMAGKMVLLR